ncbi:arsenic transporter [Paenibacillus baekrokdamisoli]|uniref:Arsenic transporter n=1 Tax=Paenibacillus baekrokdamisoli TaxID=1712516 RepID=A0A3G9IK30_9BACL|nr:arsenic transporter [Paenibacillus baekrokdamisoli]MBB3067555.1 arsenical pump membrane protein [Paenibacillus baekrokdamisoli]BBH19260.1 arsenic transporter [Paenibacillus baekrokdamisoli]
MYGSVATSITIFAFIMTVILILWRPKDINEAIPSSLGALLVLISGTVSLADFGQISATVSGAAITIMATIVMAVVLESFGFFIWAAEGLAARAKGSGIRLFWYVNLICFLMTLFFNNDGSILITTPILLILLQNLGLKNHQKIPYLLSGALVATASSAPIGVSNIVNLIALKIVHMSLYMHTLMMFVPATLGLLFMVLLLFLICYRSLPARLPVIHGKLWSHNHHAWHHPLKENAETKITSMTTKQRTRFMQKVLLFVFFVRVSLFVASYLSIPIEIVSVIGSAVLLGWRWYNLKIPPTDMIKKTPWHILVFAFGMYIIIYGIHNIGFTHWLVTYFQPIVNGSLLNASLIMGGVQSLMSTLFNNHPALMIGTLTLTEMNLDPLTLKIAYLANVVGSDIGSLLLPIGTLASLIWMHILRKNKVKIHWKDYTRITILVIPPTVLFTLFVLYYWVSWLF